MKQKFRDLDLEIIAEPDGSYGIACDSLRVYSSGKTLAQAGRNFEEALELYFSHVREKAKFALAAHAGA